MNNVSELFRNTRSTIEDRERIERALTGPTAQWMQSIIKITASTADPDEDFFYLGGPMSNLPAFNFHEFDRIAAVLRKLRYNIVSPAELDDPNERARAMASPDGRNTDKLWENCLQRDLVICCMPRCIGGIFIPGWHRSSGAALESYVLDRLGKPLLEYREDEDGCWMEQIERDGRLEALGMLEDARDREDALQKIEETA